MASFRWARTGALRRVVLGIPAVLVGGQLNGPWQRHKWTWNDSVDDDDEDCLISKSPEEVAAQQIKVIGQDHWIARQLHVPKDPYPAWDYNWDGRMAMPSHTPAALSTAEGYLASRKTGTTRHILLIRHGQYDETSEKDRKRKLTALGRHQADLTGRRLAQWAQGGVGALDGSKFGGPCRIKAIHVSDLTRAKETASIISSHLPDVKVTAPDTLLNEGYPAPIIPMRPDISNQVELVDEGQVRIETAFRKYFYRAHADSIGSDAASDSTSATPDTDGNSNDDEDRNANNNREHEFEVIVCHGNVIRYFFNRALQLPPEAWLRMSIYNCSITYIMIQPNGYCSARMLGDIGHLSYDESTFSGNHGFNW